MTAKNLLVILLFSFVVRGLAVAWASWLFPYYAYEIALLGQLIMCAMIIALSWHVCGFNRQDTQRLFGRVEKKGLLAGVLVGLLLLGFTFGEGALTTMAIAQFDAPLAYGLGNFHEEEFASQPFLSMHVAGFILANVIAAAIMEEIFFRGLLVPALARRRTVRTSVIVAAAIFTALHPQKIILVNVFLFAVVLSWLYGATRSLYPCIAAHVTYNLLAFISQHYFDFHRVRSVKQLGSLSDWGPELALMGAAVSMMALGAYHLRRRLAFTLP